MAPPSVGCSPAPPTTRSDRHASTQLFNGLDAPGLRSVTAAIHGQQAADAGVACGGQAMIVVQLTDRIPGTFWSALAAHRPVTLTTVIAGAQPSVGRSRVYIDSGTSAGTTGDTEVDGDVDDLSRRLLGNSDRGAQTTRAERLRALGASDDDLARIRGPIGLDLGGRQPSHVALSICAEVLASRSGRDGRPLAQRRSPSGPTGML